MLYKVFLDGGKRDCMVLAENENGALQVVYSSLLDDQPFFISSDTELLDTYGEDLEPPPGEDLELPPGEDVEPPPGEDD